MSSQPKQTTTQEHDLWCRACADDMDAYAQFVVLCERRIRAVLGRLLDDERDIGEASQDTFVQAWRYRHRFRGGSRPFTWLYRIAVNEAGQRNRRPKRQTRELDEQVEQDQLTAPSTVAVAENREIAEALEVGLRELPFNQRCAVVLRDVEACSTQEVADALDVSLSAAREGRERAEVALAHVLKDEPGRDVELVTVELGVATVWRFGDRLLFVRESCRG